jgi:hypothetical protein
MSTTKVRNEKMLSIYGEAEFVFLNTRDNAFSEPGEYKVTLKVPKAKSGELIRDINEIITKELMTNGKRTGEARKPYTVKGDIVEFKMHSQFKPTLWDKDQNKMDENINVWKQSTMWVNCKASGYTNGMNTGATLLMGSVQIDHLVEGASQNADTCPFPKRTPKIKLDQEPMAHKSVLPAPQKAVY